MKALLALTSLLLAGLGIFFFVLGEAPRDAPSKAPLSASNPDAPSAVAQLEMPRSVVTQSAPAEEPSLATAGERRTLTATAPASASDAGARLLGSVLGPKGVLAGAELVLSGDSRALARATSDPRGRFTLDVALPVDLSRLRVSANGFAPFETEINSLRRGETRALGNLRLAEAIALGGVVKSSAGAPLDHAVVSLRTLDNTNLHVASAISGAAGRFEFDAVPRGRVRVSAWAKGHGEKSMDQVVAGGEAIEIVLADERKLVLRLEDGGSRPVQNALVQVSSTEPGAMPREGKSDALGRLVFEGLGADLWHLRAQADGCKPTSRTGLRADGQEIPLKLDRWPAMTGRVRTPDGTPLPTGTLVVPVPRGVGAGPARMAASARRRPVGEKGEFSVSVQGQGEFVVRVEAPGFAPTDSGVAKVVREDVDVGTIVLLEAASLAFAFRAGGAGLEGVRVHLLDEEPVEAAVWNEFDPPGALAHGMSDAEGTLRFGDLCAGELWALARAEGRLPLVVGPLTVRVGSDVDGGRFELERAANLRGDVRDANGRALKGALVTIMADETVIPVAVQIVSGDDGQWSAPPLPSGRFEVRLRTSTGALDPAREPVWVDLVAGEETILPLVH